MYHKEKHYKPYMAKKNIYPGTRGRKNKVFKGPIDMTGINKVPIVAGLMSGEQKSDKLKY